MKKGHSNDPGLDYNGQCFRTCLRFMYLNDTLPQQSGISRL